MPGKMVNGRWVDAATGRPAYLGPNDEPGYAVAQRQPGMAAHTMPDGRVTYYWPTATSVNQPTPYAAPAPYTQTQQPVVQPANNAADIAAEMARQQDAFVAQQKQENQRDAYARLNEVLSQYGLGTLGSAVQSWLQQGLSEAEVLQQMRDSSEFKQRFPAIAARQAKGLAPISPGEYVAYENAARQMMRAAGLPQGFYDSTEDFTRFLVNDLSPTELGERVTMASNAAFKMPKEDRDALAAWGMGPGDLTAFWLDPDKAQPLLERKYAAAQLAGAATRTTFGTLSEQTATELATLGVSAQQAEQGFSTLAGSRELFASLDSTEDVIDQGTQLGAAFGGNANAQRRIEQRKRKRQSTFEGGGGFASSQQGLVGLGDTE